MRPLILCLALVGCGLEATAEKPAPVRATLSNPAPPIEVPPPPCADGYSLQPIFEGGDMFTCEPVPAPAP